MSWVTKKRKLFFCLTSDRWIPLSDALPLSQRDSVMSKAYHEVHMR